jgi:hypothetical protein
VLFHELIRMDFTDEAVVNAARDSLVVVGASVTANLSSLKLPPTDRRHALRLVRKCRVRLLALSRESRSGPLEGIAHRGQAVVARPTVCDARDSWLSRSSRRRRVGPSEADRHAEQTRGLARYLPC